MPALDGKYRIISELGEEGFLRTYAAQSPQGPGTLYWFEVHTPEARAAFHRYRSALKRLEALGALPEVTISAKPGRYYVFWPRIEDEPALPPKGRRVEQEITRVLEALAPLGYALPDLDLRFGDAGLKVADLKPLAHHPPSEVRILNGRLGRPARRRAPGRRRWDLAGWAPGLFFLILGLWAFGTGATRYLNPPEHVLPDLRGQDPRKALEIVQGMGLRVEFTEVSKPTAPPDTILSQNPLPGTRVKPGRRLVLVLNRPKPGRVPELSGLGLAEAEAVLSENGYRLGSIARVHTSAPADTVVATRPPSGTPLPLGEAVDLLISLGPRPRETLLPDLVGLSLDEARYLVSVAGLQLAKITEVPSPRPAGEVLAQSPPGGSVVAAGSAVDLVVSANAELLLPPAAPTPPPSLPSPAGATTVPVRITIPPSPDETKPRAVRLVVQDADGEREILNTLARPGEVIQGSVEVRGAATFRLILDGTLYREWRVEP